MAAAPYTSLLVTDAPGVREVTLNRPDVRNALDDTLISELNVCIAEASGSGAVRALVLRGSGAAFCAGADLGWMARAAHFTYADNIADAGALQSVLAALAEFPGVTIAAVHGPAVGGGAGLAAACDITIALPDAWFQFSEVRLGLVPAMIAPYVLDRIGPGAARAAFLTAERISAERARNLGLVNILAPDAGAFEASIRETVGRALAGGPAAIAAVKQLLRDLRGRSAQEAGEITADCIARARVSPEGQEGMRAFLEKRRPNYAIEPGDRKQTGE